MTDAQGGGRPGTSTNDHLIILKQAIQTAKNKQQPLYIALLDVKKAYDKAWMTGISKIMYDRGVRDFSWKVMYELNRNVTAKLITKFGETRTIKIKDSLRQGGVLPTLQYGILTDQINQALQELNIGITIEDTQILIACILWVDDVLLMANSLENLQQQLDEVNSIAKKYRIEFGIDKSNVMKIGGRKEAITMMPVGDTPLTQTTKYKYLGYVQNDENTLHDHLNMIEGKVEAAMKTLLSTANEEILSKLQMKTIWKLLEATIVPIISNTAETWDPTKEESKRHDSILENAIRRILLLPKTTPREAVYIETGILNPTTTRIISRINAEKRINEKATETTKILKLT